MFFSRQRDRRSGMARRNCRPRFEALEARAVLSFVFDSVAGVGNDTDSILPKANAVDAAGNTYVTGILYGTMDLDPLVDRPDGSDILTPPGSTSAFIAKYAPDNTLIWARQVGTTYQLSTNPNDPIEQGRAIAVDASGNVYVSGDFVGVAHLGSITLTSTGSTDIFVAKLDASGNFLWANRWGGASTRDFGYDLAVDGSGNVISTGFTANLTSNGAWYANGFEIRKFNSNGVAVWTRRYDNLGGLATNVATDTAGNVYIAGSFNGTLDFNPDSRKTAYVTGAGGYSGGQAYNGFVLKLTSAGAFGWVSPFIAKTGEAAGSAAYPSGLSVDTTGNVVVGGTYVGQVDFDPNTKVDRRLPNVSSPSSGFVVKLSASGALSWATPLGVNGLNNLALDAAGNVYATGTYSTVFTPGNNLPTITSNGSSDVFLARISPTGVVQSAVGIGGASSELCYAVAVGPQGTVSLTGAFRSSVDFDPDPSVLQTLNNTTYTDMFLLRFRQI